MDLFHYFWYYLTMKKQNAEKFVPVVVWANNYQFAKNEKITQSCVESRMLLWCKIGRGEVRVNAQRFAMNPGDFMLLPWRRRLEYHPDSKTPFLVAGIHIIPRHARNHPVEFEVAHSRSHRLFEKPWRADALTGTIPSFLAGCMEWNAQLKFLAEYIVACQPQVKHDEELAMVFGKLLCAQLATAVTKSRNGETMPQNLIQIMEYVKGHIIQKISITDMAEIGQCSISTVIRLFRRHFSASPIQWLLQFRISQAAALLGSTQLHVGEIGRRVGIDDPYYFSKLFKRFNGKTAKNYRSRNASI